MRNRLSDHLAWVDAQPIAVRSPLRRQEQLERKLDEVSMQYARILRQYKNLFNDFVKSGFLDWGVQGWEAV
jgi:hypothetical protein